MTTVSSRGKVAFWLVFVLFCWDGSLWFIRYKFTIVHGTEVLEGGAVFPFPSYVLH